MCHNMLPIQLIYANKKRKKKSDLVTKKERKSSYYLSTIPPENFTDHIYIYKVS
jgi:hypothetical protein